jgi:ankyrin repeat protein
MNRDELRKVIEEFDSRPISRLIAAAERGDVKAIRAALDEGASVAEHEPLYGRTALHAAAGNGATKAVERLIAEGAPLDALDGNKMTPLMCACSSGKREGSEVALLLLESGADPLYTRDADGMDAIKFAMWGRCSDHVLQKLRESGAIPPGPEFKVVHLN